MSTLTRSTLVYLIAAALLATLCYFTYSVFEAAFPNVWNAANSPRWAL